MIQNTSLCRERFRPCLDGESWGLEGSLIPCPDCYWVLVGLASVGTGLNAEMLHDQQLAHDAGFASLVDFYHWRTAVRLQRGTHEC